MIYPKIHSFGNQEQYLISVPFINIFYIKEKNYGFFLNFSWANSVKRNQKLFSGKNAVLIYKRMKESALCSHECYFYTPCQVLSPTESVNYKISRVWTLSTCTILKCVGQMQISCALAYLLILCLVQLNLKHSKLLFTNKFLRLQCQSIPQ